MVAYISLTLMLVKYYTYFEGLLNQVCHTRFSPVFGFELILPWRVLSYEFFVAVFERYPNLTLL